VLNKLLKHSGHQSVTVSLRPMMLGAYTESGIYMTCMNSAWEVQNCYQKLVIVMESAAYVLHRLEQNLDPSTNLWPPWACHCWECHQQNV